jgi:hypothetical protein
MARRSCSVAPPHMPSGTAWSNAHARHGVRTGHAWRMRLASSMWRSAGPVALTGKNRSGSAWRQAALSRQFALLVTSSPGTLRSDVSAWSGVSVGDVVPVKAVGVGLG